MDMGNTPASQEDAVTNNSVTAPISTANVVTVTSEVANETEQINTVPATEISPASEVCVRWCARLCQMVLGCVRLCQVVSDSDCCCMYQWQLNLLLRLLTDDVSLCQMVC